MRTSQLSARGAWIEDVRVKVSVTNTYTDLLSRSRDEYSVFRDVRYNKKRCFLVLDYKANDSIHDNLIGNIEACFF